MIIDVAEKKNQLPHHKILPKKQVTLRKNEKIFCDHPVHKTNPFMDTFTAPKKRNK